MFTIKIKLGNDGMNTPRNVAEYLKRLAPLLEDMPDRASESGVILDVNGASVGTWTFTNV